MPWQETDVSSERIKFVILANRGEKSFADLCREFQISRQTGYTWWKRYRDEGAGGVYERSRRPQHSPGETSAEVTAAVTAVRQQRPDWGARKVQCMVKDQHPEWKPVSVSTVHRILLRNELVAEQDRHRAAVKRFERSLPNQLWQMDFKGPAGFNKGVGPLSIQDDHSRYLLTLQNLGSTKLEGVRKTLERTFVDNGLPDMMLVDHGTPWWNGANVSGWTELTVWIMRQGIRITFSGIRHPQTQGKIERMHGALQAAVRKRQVLADDQAWLDEFRHEYNHVRPHEALGMQPPASRWRKSERAFQPNPPEWEYAPGMVVVRLSKQGQLNWRGQRWEISHALRGQTVGVEVIDDRALVIIRNTPIREIHLSSSRSVALPVARPGSLS